MTENEAVRNTIEHEKTIFVGVDLQYLQHPFRTERRDAS